MTKLLMAIERRTRYLDRAFPKEMIRSRGAMIPIDLPGDPWADRYREMNPIPASLMPSIEKIYGAEAEQRNESSIVTMIRYAANAGKTG